MSDIVKQYRAVKQSINDYENKYGLPTGKIRLVCVSKKKPIDAIIKLTNVGQKDFAENFVNEALEKIKNCQHKDINWHFIGTIQSNKTKLIAENFSWAQSVDRIKIIERLAKQRPIHMNPLNICLQINISGETSKGGTTYDELDDLIQCALSFDSIKLRGLMGVPTPLNSFAQQKQSFKKIGEYFYHYQQQGIPLDTLSIGMTNDMEAAIASGSTMVRVGTAIFGKR